MPSFERSTCNKKKKTKQNFRYYRSSEYAPDNRHSQRTFCKGWISICTSSSSSAVALYCILCSWPIFFWLTVTYQSEPSNFAWSKSYLDNIIVFLSRYVNAKRAPHHKRPVFIVDLMHKLYITEHWYHAGSTFSWVVSLLGMAPWSPILK